MIGVAGRSNYSKGRGAAKAAVWLGVYLLLFIVFAFVASRNMDGRSLVVALCSIECAMLAVIVALFSVGLDPRENGNRRFVVRLLAVCVPAVAGSVIVIIVAALLQGGDAADAPNSAQLLSQMIAAGLIAQLVILSFCLLLGAVFALVRCSGSELLFAQLVAILVASMLLGTVFYADPIVESQKSPEARSTVISLALAANPITAISGALPNFDLMRREMMYSRISVIGRFYPANYPEWWRTALGYMVTASVILLGAGVLRRYHRLKGAGGEGGGA